jgi:acyl carrier protein
MAQVTLVGAIEDQFDLVLDIDEAQGVVDWDSCVRVVAGKLGG